MRFYVSVEDVRSGQQLLDAGKLQEALQKFQHAAEIDETNFFAQAQARQIADLLQTTVMKVFYLRNLATPAELQEAANTLKGILNIIHIQLGPAQNAMILQGTPDQMAVPLACPATSVVLLVAISRSSTAPLW